MMKISGSEGQGGKGKSASATRRSGGTAVCLGACWYHPNTTGAWQAKVGRDRGCGQSRVGASGKRPLQKLHIKQFSKIKVTLIL